MYALLIVNALSMYIFDCFFSNNCVFMKQYTYWNIPIVITSFVIEEKNITDAFSKYHSSMVCWGILEVSSVSV